MKKAEHMMSSMTMEKLTEYQNEYTALLKNKTSTPRQELLEIIFTKVDMGKIRIKEYC